MERRFEVRKEELIADCQVDPVVFRGIEERLQRFAEPFVDRLGRPEQREHAQTYFQGLLSDVEKKNAESIAYRHDEDRQGLQTFIGTAPWDDQPLRKELTRQVGEELGEADGVITFDPSAFPKKGKHSVGVSRQWCGRLGKLENCQVGVFMGYASRSEQALVDMRLYLPQKWAKDKERRKECGIPRGIRYRTRHQLALEMLDEEGPLLPHMWVTGDDEMGRPAWFRRDLSSRGEQYLLGVPSNTTVRDLEGETPTYGGRGRKPKRRFEQARRWCESLPEDAWTRVEVRDGEKGPLVIKIVKRRVVARIDRKVGPDETLVVTRTADEEGAVKYDYYLSNASPETPLREFARVTKAAHRIEECIKRGKSQAGMADYQVRTWLGWHHHITLSLIATWFLVQEARRGKKVDASHHGSADPGTSCPDFAPRLRMRHTRSHPSRMHPSTRAQRTRQVLSPSNT